MRYIIEAFRLLPSDENILTARSYCKFELGDVQGSREDKVRTNHYFRIFIQIVRKTPSLHGEDVSTILDKRQNEIEDVEQIAAAYLLVVMLYAEKQER